MSTLHALYDRPVFKREIPLADGSAVVRWWESRRIFFNLALFYAGIVTCFLCLVCGFISEPIVGEAIGIPDGLLLGGDAILIYGILANFFYTFGWVFELLLRTTETPEKSAAISIRAFRVGVSISVILTLLPSLLCWLVFGYAVLTGQKHGPPPE